jgi:phosphoglycerate kinase
MTPNEKGLPVIQDADLADKVVLVRVDHNVVKKGLIKDPYRIDRTMATLFNIAQMGGRMILMSHVGRPRDKKTGQITCDAATSTEPIAAYLQRKLHAKFFVPIFPVEEGRGIVAIDALLQSSINDLKERKIAAIYLSNTRWFEGEEVKGEPRASFARQLAAMAEVYVNDAFGSWQPHASTYDVAKHIPAFAGFLMQEEIAHLDQVLNPKRPFVAVVAGAKFDTKIGPLNELYKKVDHLILGGVIYNTFLSAKYNVQFAGVPKEDIAIAKELVAMDKDQKKILELPSLVEADALGEKIEGQYRPLDLQDLVPGQSYGHILDIDKRSFSDDQVARALGSAKTVFVNAVMGFAPHFMEGTEALFRTIAQNTEARKLYGGGDTIQEFKALCPGLFISAADDPLYYFFTGGGAVLKSIEQDQALGMEPLKALIKNKQTFPNPPPKR